jgi:hypothetical protein
MVPAALVVLGQHFASAVFRFPDQRAGWQSLGNKACCEESRDAAQITAFTAKRASSARQAIQVIESKPPIVRKSSPAASAQRMVEFQMICFILPLRASRHASLRGAQARRGSRSMAPTHEPHDGSIAAFFLGKRFAAAGAC